MRSVKALAARVKRDISNCEAKENEITLLSDTTRRTPYTRSEPVLPFRTLSLGPTGLDLKSFVQLLKYKLVIYNNKNIIQVFTELYKHFT